MSIVLTIILLACSLMSSDPVMNRLFVALAIVTALFAYRSQLSNGQEEVVIRLDSDNETDRK
jgi:hypothetical protein